MEKNNIVCFGDSITQGPGLSESHRWPSRLAFHLEHHAPDIFSVYNRGTGGDTTAIGLDRFRSDIAPLLPATVLIEFGINDAYVYPWCRHSRVSLGEFVRNLNEIVRAVRKAGGKPILIINHPLASDPKFHTQGNGKTIRQNIAPYSAAARRFAHAGKVDVIDLPLWMRRERIAASKLLSDDGVHLSPEGNRIYARLVTRAFARIEGFKLRNPVA